MLPYCKDKWFYFCQLLYNGLLSRYRNSDNPEIILLPFADFSSLP